MLTKRKILGAGALALALAVAACSEDGAGGPTAVNETPGVAARPAPATPPAALSAPSGFAVTTGDGSIQGPPPPADDEGVSFEANGHRYAIVVVPSGTSGVTRIIQDGAILMEVGGTPASLATATDASVTLFFEGQAVFSDMISLRGTALASIPERFRSARQSPGGPQLQQALPCMAELAAFGAAAAWLSYDLFMMRYFPGSISVRDLVAAGSAVVGTGYALYRCLAVHW